MINAKRHAPVSTATLPVLMDVVADPRSSARDVADVIGRDVGLSARVLGLANSAQFGLSRTVSRLDLAVGLVGTSMIQTLAIASSCTLLDRTGTMSKVQTHAMNVASASRLLAPAGEVLASDAFAAGLLHDVGELLLLQAHPTEYAEVSASFLSHDHQLIVEQDLFGGDHALIGAEHLLSWRVPEIIVDAVADHHDPFWNSHGVTIVVAAADELMADDDDRHHALDLLEIDPDQCEGLRARAATESLELAAALA